MAGITQTQLRGDLNDTPLTNEQKAALMLITMGVSNASEVMKNLTEAEIEKIAVQIALLNDVTSQVLSSVLEEFYQLMQANEFITQGGLGYARKVLESAYGRKKAEDIINRVEATTEVSAFFLLQTVDDKRLINFLQNEHPQTVALILANLKTPQAANIISELPPESQSEIILRLATMEKTSPELIEEIEMVLREQMGTVFGGDLSTTGGAASVAGILNSTSSASEKNILSHIKSQDTDLYDEITSLMFVFEDISSLTDTAVQNIVKGVDSNTLALALKTASDKLKEKVFANMSSRASDMLRDELEYLGPTRIRDIEKAQKQILDVVRNLEEEGLIVISRSEDEEIVE